jgi:hypothetical protein
MGFYALNPLCLVQHVGNCQAALSDEMPRGLKSGFPSLHEMRQTVKIKRSFWSASKVKTGRNRVFPALLPSDWRQPFTAVSGIR